LIALVKDDDEIEIDINNHKLQLHINEEEIIERRSKWNKPALKATKGVLFKYAQHVKSAAEGCVTDAI
jgi:dihydroxy-acid dehydratase